MTGGFEMATTKSMKIQAEIDKVKAKISEQQARLYVGDGKMLHCGDPIGYANLNTSYWQSHFYAYGRLP